jgi:hypothetical protein
LTPDGALMPSGLPRLAWAFFMVAGSPLIGLLGGKGLPSVRDFGVIFLILVLLSITVVGAETFLILVILVVLLLMVWLTWVWLILVTWEI